MVKLLLAVDGNENQDRSPQLVNMQRIRNFGMLGPKWEVYITLFPSKLRGIFRRNSGKIVRG